MTPAEARRFHENKFLLDEDFKSLANAAINPTANQVNYLHSFWRQANLGSLINPFEKLKEKVPLYEANGTTVHIRDGDSWAVVLATSVMKRIQKSQFAKEMIFVDSTTGCEGSSSTMTILLVASKIGALPICVLIHPNQTMESYENAFDLMKKSFPQCFGGNDHPEIFMTDNSSAEKGALKRVWKKSTQLLCHFHDAQAEWHWLFTHDIPKDERPRLMRLFQAVMYATSENDLDRATCDILKERFNYPDFVKRFQSFYNRKNEWVLFFRKDLLTRQNNTNNLAEISIRILKDIVLCRTKAFNVVALCEFCITVWDFYLIKRLLDYAYMRKHEVTILYSSLFKKISHFSESDIENINSSTYKIKSGENNYIINVDIGACSCAAGIYGAFCKHQCFLMNLKKIHLPNAPPITQLDRHELALLALGPKCPEISFFVDFVNFEGPSDLIAMPQPQQSDTKDEERSLQITSSHQMATTEQKEILSKEFKRLASLVSGEITSDCANRLLQTLKKIETVEDFKNVFVVRKIGQRTKKIKVQPTSIARRQGLVKSSSKLPSGRPPLSAIKKCKKRKRLLNQNIVNNTQNAKSHGVAH